MIAWVKYCFYNFADLNFAVCFFGTVKVKLFHLRIGEAHFVVSADEFKIKVFVKYCRQRSDWS